VRVPRSSDQFFEVRKDAADYDDTDRTGQLDLLIANLEFVLVDVIDQLLSPCHGVALVASFKQGHNDSTFEAAGDVPWVHAIANFLRELHQDFFGIEDPDGFANLRKIVGFNVRDRV